MLRGTPDDELHSSVDFFFRASAHTSFKAVSKASIPTIEEDSESLGRGTCVFQVI